MTVREAAESRRAIHKYVQEEVPEEDLREILRQTRLAPSPDNFQSWRFVWSCGIPSFGPGWFRRR